LPFESEGTIDGDPAERSNNSDEERQTAYAENGLKLE